MNTPESKRAAQPVVSGCKRWRWIAVAAMAALAGCNPTSSPQDAKSAGDGWHEFQGSWTATGSRRVISLGGERRASIVSLTGSMVLAGPSRPGVGFRAEVVGMSDTAAGFTGRAVWTDEKGDQVYSELRGDGTATRNQIEGTFLGGTGRYAGATGSYEFSWQYVLEAEDGTVQGRTVGLKGKVRVGQPRSATAAGGENP
jgi:hypothetical protein